MKSKQVKITVEPAIATAFKSACKNSGVSMTIELTKFMEEHAKMLNQSYAKNHNHNRLRNRGGRRKEIDKYILLLEAVRDAEDSYRSKIPENLVSGPAYESSEQAIESLDQAIELLREAYYI